MKATARMRGFTLIEIMAASVITAFIILIAISGLVSTLSGRGRLEEASAAMDDLRYAADCIQNDLNNAYRNSNELLFEGTLEETPAGIFPRLKFRAIRNEQARPLQPEGDLYEVEYFMADGIDEPWLARRVCPIIGTELMPDETAGGMLTKLNQAIAYFGIRYFDGTQWLDEWSIELKKLPMLVEVSFVIKREDANDKGRIYAKQVLVNYPRYGSTDEMDTEQFEWQDPEELMIE